MAICGAALFSSSVRPINAAAAELPTERTVRFYVTRKLVSRPEGRGTAAVYQYRHLLQVLFIKLRQMEGATLTTIAGELAELTGDVLERRVASALGDRLPTPARLPLPGDGGEPRGRSGRLFGPIPERETAAASGAPVGWLRLEIAPGIELHLRQDHPFVRDVADTNPISQAVLLALSRVNADTD